MASKIPRIVIIGAGMAGLTAANKLYTSAISNQLLVLEGGSRIGGRINSSEFCGDRIELGATWIHGIEGSPVYRIAQERNLLRSHQPWECKDGFRLPVSVTLAEGGHELDPSFVDPISRLFKNLIRFIAGKPIDDDCTISNTLKRCVSNCGDGDLSVGSFLRKGLEAYWSVREDEIGIENVGDWSRKSLEEAVFATHENSHRNYNAVDDLGNLDCVAEKEYKLFPGEEITIARGYSEVIEYLASVLPEGTIQLGRKVEKIEWQVGIGEDGRPVKLHFSDGTTLCADHVIVTVSLGVLKRGIGSGMFSPPLPSCKIDAISRLGFGLLNKVFLELPSHDFDFPFTKMVFHQPNSELKQPEIPSWIRRTPLLYPIYSGSRVVLCWISGKEALQLESLAEEEIVNGFSETASNLLSSRLDKSCNLKFGRVLRTQWGTDPLFLGSYSHVAVGSSGDDMDTLSEPLPGKNSVDASPPLQILFAGEATDRTYYGTTHAAYLSGLREANRLLDHYSSGGV